jgi:DNA-binding winged helix-turn-helix (wHTH) protein
MEAYWEFAGMRLWEQSRRLVTRKGTFRLAPQQHELLLFFLRHPQELVAKKQIMDLLWHGHPNVSEHRLETLLSDLRRMFGRKDMLETISRVGYRWLLAVKRVDPANQKNSQDKCKDAAPKSSERKGRRVGEHYSLSQIRDSEGKLVLVFSRFDANDHWQQRYRVERL